MLLLRTLLLGSGPQFFRSCFLVDVGIVALDASVHGCLVYFLVPGSAFVGNFSRLYVLATRAVAAFTAGAFEARCGLGAHESPGLAIAGGMALEAVGVGYFIALENIEVFRVLGAFPGLIAFHMAHTALIGTHILGLLGSAGGVGNQTAGQGKPRHHGYDNCNGFLKLHLITSKNW